MTWDTNKLLSHIEAVSKIKGSTICFGGKKLENHSIPSCYGAIEPTAIFVPLNEIIKNWELCSTEVFGPIQIITEYKSEEIDTVLEMLGKFEQNLTAAIVSNDPIFVQKIIGNTINGTTYCGIRARTSGAPQNHWFGPAGDPRAAGIGSPEAIVSVWSCHREIISDVGPIPKDWVLPEAS